MAETAIHFRGSIRKAQTQVGLAEDTYMQPADPEWRRGCVWVWGAGWGEVHASAPANVDVALLFQLFFFRGCGLHGYLLPPVPSSHGLLLPGDLVVGIHSFL